MTYRLEQWTPRRAGSTLAVFGLLVATLGCASHFVMSTGSPGLAISALRARNSEMMVGRAGGGPLRVHYAPGEEELAKAALAEAARSVAFAAARLGREPRDSIRIYLYPWPQDEPVPSYTLRGRGYRTVAFYSDSQDLMSEENVRARDTLRSGIVHKVAIRFLLRTKYLDPLQDRWLLEGLAEALADEYTREVDPGLWLLERRWNPPAAVLHVSVLEGWTDRELFAMIEAFRKGDERLAGYYGFREARRLAAARGFVLEWLKAARDGGVQEPVRDLLARLESAPPPDWDATKRLARELTGQTVEELSRLSPDEVAALQRHSWERRDAPDVVERVHALRVLSYLGLPEDADLAELERVLTIAETLDSADRSRLIEAAAGALAQSADPALASRVIASLQREGEHAFGSISLPRLWHVVGRAERDAGIAGLLAILQNDDYSLVVQEVADQSLRALTGTSAGWSATLPPAKRTEAVARWLAIAERSAA